MRFAFVFVLFVSALSGNQNTYLKYCNFVVHFHRDVWSEAFSPKGPGGEGMKALDAWDLRNSFGQKKSKFNKNEEVMNSQSVSFSDAAQLYSVLSFEAITAALVASYLSVAHSPFLRLFLCLFLSITEEFLLLEPYCYTSHIPHA
jgi:hypothetical protein